MSLLGIVAVHLCDPVHRMQSAPSQRERLTPLRRRSYNIAQTFACVNTSSMSFQCSVICIQL